MKKFWVALAATLLLVPMTVNVASAATVTDFGSPDATATKAWGTYKKYQYSETDGAQTLFYAEYKATDTSDYEFVVHDVRNSSGNVTLSTVANIAADYTADTGRKVLFATNGDFFDSTGASIDSLVQDGEVIKTGTYTNKNAFGFDNNGNAVVGRVTETKDVLQVSLDGKTYRLDIGKTNIAPTDGELSLYTTAQNLAIPDCVKYKVTIEGGSTITTTRPLIGEAKLSTAADKPLTLSTGQFAIVVKQGSKLAEFISKALVFGADVKVIKAPAGEFSGMDYVVGGWDILVEDGKIVPSTHSTASDPNGGGANAPRTFIAMKPDGTMFLAVLDGRQSGYSVGCTVAEEGKLALALGASVALELDGGGSSTFLFDSGNGLATLNKPSDGSARRVSNAILLVEKDKDATYYDLDDYTPSSGNGGNGGSSGGNTDSGDSGNQSSADSGSGDNGGNGEENGGPVMSFAGCFGGIGGMSVVVSACLLCGLSLIKKQRGE